MTINQILDEQMKEFDERFPGDVTTMEEDGLHARITSSLYNRDSLKSFIHSFSRKLIESLAEEILGSDIVHAKFCAKKGEQYKKCCACLLEEKRLKVNEILSNLK